MVQSGSVPKEEETDPNLVQNLTRELSAKEVEVQHLLTDVQQLKKEKETLQLETNSKLGNLQYEKEESVKLIQSLEMKLERQSDYEAIKKDLAILKSMEFSQTYPSGEQQDNGEEVKRPLEVMILER